MRYIRVISVQVHGWVSARIFLFIIYFFCQRGLVQPEIPIPLREHHGTEKTAAFIHYTDMVKNVLETVF